MELIFNFFVCNQKEYFIRYKWTEIQKEIDY
jgi:hypothetical protein